MLKKEDSVSIISQSKNEKSYAYGCKVEAPKGAKIRSFNALGGRVSFRAFTIFLANQ
jgi:hypothetical protein